MSLLLFLDFLRALCGLKEKKQINAIAAGLTPVICFDQQEREAVKRRKFASRRIRSVRLGELNVKIERGYDSQGQSVVPVQLGEFVPKGRSFSYDTIWEVTRMRYVENMQREEILKALPFNISTGSISNLYTDGLAYFRACHEQAIPSLKKLYVNEERPFIVQLDGTNEGGANCLFQVRESHSGNVLLARHIPTENKADLKLILSEIEEKYAKPDGVICDMSPNILAAIKELWHGEVPVFLCQFHFLRDIGKDLLHGSYEQLRKAMSATAVSRELRRTRLRLEDNIRTRGNRDKVYYCEQVISMIDWVSDYKNELKGLGYPFDLSFKSYYERCQKMDELISSLRHKPGNIPKVGYSVINMLKKRLERVVGNGSLKRIYNTLEKEYALFNEIRGIFKITENDDHQAPLSRDLKAAERELPDSADINVKIDAVIAKLRTQSNKLKRGKRKNSNKNRYEKAIEQLEKYRHQLANHITLDGKVFTLPRTNNLCEQSFRELKRKLRRTNGKKNLSYTLDRTPAEIMYLQNYSDDEYRRTVFGNGEVYEAFAQIPQKRIKEIRHSMKSRHIRKKDFKVIRRPDFIAESVKRLKKRVA